MESSVAWRCRERRRYPRATADRVGWRAVRLRTGDALLPINVAPGGMLVESTRRLLPGTTVIVQIIVDDGVMTMRAEVVRCTVHALGCDAVRYRGALAFAEPHEIRP